MGQNCVESVLEYFLHVEGMSDVEILATMVNAMKPSRRKMKNVIGLNLIYNY
jgi:hypothetical protein